LAGIGFGLAGGTTGFAATGGGLRGSDCIFCLDNCVKVGLGDLISGFWSLLGFGDGVKALVGRGDTARGGPGDRREVGVIDLFMGALLRLCDDTAFCSNIPIKEVVGGIGLVSSG
jgi:hypothetical protein